MLIEPFMAGIAFECQALYPGQRPVEVGLTQETNVMARGSSREGKMLELAWEIGVQKQNPFLAQRFAA